MVTGKVNDQVRLGYGKSGPRHCDVVLSPGEGKEEAEEGLCWKGVISPQHSSATAAAHREWLRVSRWAREKLPLRSLGSTEFG